MLQKAGIFFILAFISFVPCIAQDTETDAEEKEKRKKVRTLTERIITYEYGKPSGEKKMLLPIMTKGMKQKK